MASSLELAAGDGGKLRLTEALIPGKGKPVTVRARNAGTTVIHTISVGVEGPGAEHVELSGDGEIWTAQELRLDPLSPGSTETFYARTTYQLEDVEDRMDFKLVASATSVG